MSKKKPSPLKPIDNKLYELVGQNTAMLRDNEACPTAPLTDNAITIRDEYFDNALASLLARIQRELKPNRSTFIQRPGDWRQRRLVHRFTVSTRSARRNARFLLIRVSAFPGPGTVWGGLAPVWEPASDGFYITLGFVEVGTGLMWRADYSGRGPKLTTSPCGCIFRLDSIPPGAFADGSFDGLGIDEEF